MEKLKILRDMENDFLINYYMGNAHFNELNIIKHYIECYYTVDEELKYYKLYYNKNFNVEVQAYDYGFNIYNRLKREEEEKNRLIRNPKSIKSFDYFRLFATDRLISKEERQKLLDFIRFYPDYYEGLNVNDISEEDLIKFKKAYIEGCLKERSRYSFRMIKEEKESIIMDVGGRFIFRLAKGRDELTKEFVSDMIYDASFLKDLYKVDKELCREVLVSYAKEAAKKNNPLDTGKLDVLLGWECELLREDKKDKLAFLINEIIVSEIRNSISEKTDCRRKK